MRKEYDLSKLAWKRNPYAKRLKRQITIRLTDPFGMCELVRSFTSTDTFVVTPLVERLPSVPLGGDWTGRGESKARSIARRTSGCFWSVRASGHVG